MAYGQSARNSILGRYKQNAKTAGRVWALTDDLFNALTTSLCHYCGNPPSNEHALRTGFGKFRYNGIDRKDSLRGYEPDNVVPACKECQKAKSDTSYDRFIAFLKRAGHYQLKTGITQPLSREVHGF